MYSPHLQHLLVRAHIQELQRFRQACNTEPITTNERIAARHRNAVRLPVYLAHAIERLVGQSAPEAYAV